MMGVPFKILKQQTAIKGWNRPSHPAVKSFCLSPEKRRTFCLHGQDVLKVLQPFCRVLLQYLNAISIIILSSKDGIQNRV